MLSKLNIPKRLRKSIDNELQSKEFIRWVEQPIPRFFTSSSIGSFVIAILWISFVLYWIWGALGYKFPDLSERMQPQDLFALFGVPFLLIGFWMLISPLREWLKAFRIVYLITNKRAISIEGGWVVTIRSYTPIQLNDLYRKERRDGTGNVVITTRTRRRSNGRSWAEEIGFMNVRNPKEVEKLLRELAHLEA